MVNCSVVWQIKFKFVQRTEKQLSLLLAPELRSLHFWLYGRASGLTELPVCTSGKTPEWKVYTGLRSAPAPIPMASSSGKLNHILHLSVWLCGRTVIFLVSIVSKICFCWIHHILFFFPHFKVLGFNLFIWFLQGVLFYLWVIFFHYYKIHRIASTSRLPVSFVLVCLFIINKSSLHWVLSSHPVYWYQSTQD